MLSDSLDPDQDLQSGSKLFTWYDVCCNIRGGGGGGGGGGWVGGGGGGGSRSGLTTRVQIVYMV